MRDASPAAQPPRLPGILRAFVLLHETESLGAGTSVLRAVDALGEYGWSVSGWCPARGPLAEVAVGRLASVETANRPLAFSVRGWREHPGVRARVVDTPAYLRAVRSALSRVRPHVVHANTLLALPEATAARSCGLPVVVHVHEIPNPSVKRTLTIRAAARVADVFVAVSEAVASMLRPHAGRTPVIVAHNGVPSPPLEDRPARSDAGDFVVGTIGTVSRVKGTDVFATAATLLPPNPDIRFEHVGAPGLHRDGGLDEALDRLVLVGEGKLALLGTQPAERVLPRWDAFVLASRSEAFPLATLEAMAAGLPVIATAVGGVPEQIEHLVNGILVPPDDAQAIVSWVIRLREDETLRRRLGEAAARRVRSQFTIERQAQQLHRAYLTALNLRFGPPSVRASARAAT